MSVCARFAIFGIPGIALSLAASFQTPVETKPVLHISSTERVVLEVEKTESIDRSKVSSDLQAPGRSRQADFNNQVTSGPEFDIETGNSLDEQEGTESAEPLIGSNWIVLLGYLINGPPPIEPEFNAETGHSMTGKNATVAVVCYAPREVTFDHDSIDYKVAKYTTYRLHENHIKVIDPDKIRAWLDTHKDWEEPEEIGAAFDVDYVIYIDLLRFSLYEEHSSHLYRGRAEAMISVIEMDEAHEDGEKIFSKDILSKYPLLKARATHEISSTAFRLKYLSRLSEEIGRLFYEHYAADDIMDAY